MSLFDWATWVVVVVDISIILVCAGNSLINKLNSRKCQRCKSRLDADFFCSPCHETCVCTHMRLYHHFEGSKCIMCAFDLNPDEECEIFNGSRREEYQAAAAFLGEGYFE